MARNHESVLYVVDKRRYRQKKVIKSYIFRTRKAANDFQEERNIASNSFEYSEPRKAEWGPDNV
jgi:hypothetical protein